MAISCTVRIDDYKHEELVKLAKANKRNKSFYIREAIDDYLFDQREADIALERKKDKNNKTLTSEEATEYLRTKYNV